MNKILYIDDYIGFIIFCWFCCMWIVCLFMVFVFVLELGVNGYGGIGFKKLLLILLVLFDFVLNLVWCFNGNCDSDMCIFF